MSLEHHAIGRIRSPATSIQPFVRPALREEGQLCSFRNQFSACSSSLPTFRHSGPRVLDMLASDVASRRTVTFIPTNANPTIALNLALKFCFRVSYQPCNVLSVERLSRGGSDG